MIHHSTVFILIQLKIFAMALGTPQIIEDNITAHRIATEMFHIGLVHQANPAASIQSGVITIQKWKQTRFSVAAVPKMVFVVLENKLSFKPTLVGSPYRDLSERMF